MNNQFFGKFPLPSLAIASLCFTTAIGSSVQAQFSNANRSVSSRASFRQNFSGPAELLRLPSSARVDDSFQELDTGIAGTYTFINAPSRFRYRFSGRYNGYANRPRPFLYRSYTQQLNVGDARRLCSLGYTTANPA